MTAYFLGLLLAVALLATGAAFSLANPSHIITVRIDEGGQQ